MASGFWASRALHLAVNLEVFTRLGGKRLDLEGAALTLGIHPRPAGRLLNACVALGLLEKEEGTYRNSELAEEFLVQGRPSYYGHFISMLGGLYKEWLELEKAVRENGPVRSIQEGWEENQEFARTFTLAILSSILHSLGPEGCCSLIRETFECLNPGGCVAILDYLLNEEKSGPSFAALFSLNMLLGTEEGDVYTGGEVRRWLKEVGFQEIEERPFAGPVSLITGVK